MDTTEESSHAEKDEKKDESIFKKPSILIGSMKGKGKKIKQILPQQSTEEQAEAETDMKAMTESSEIQNEETESMEKCEKEKRASDQPDLTPCPYKEPSWGKVANKKYQTEILKSGVILETIDLSQKSYYVVGRLPSCDISLAHPSISRFHAIFQYGCLDGDENKEGLYLYDLGSTHGTFWNGCKVKTNMYIKLHGGHMITFGGSKRKFIIVTPPEDEEPESTYTVTELKEMRRLELEERQKQERLEKMRQEEEERLREEEGIDWGMGEDAEEETEDLEENPYAQTENHELYLNDPKKTLRGWFEREGYNLHYEVEEKAPGQFLCYVDLPITDARGRDIRAEALVKGKKKESVVQCAMEACKILDMHGYLRQSHHESRKKRKSNAEDDYYNSDDDDFLDRTGSVEKKRNKKLLEDGDSLSLAEKYTTIVGQIKQLEKLLRSKNKSSKNQTTDEDDELDNFMSAINKGETAKIESDLKKLNLEKTQLEELMNKV